MGKRKPEVTEKKIMTANEFTDVRDVKGGIIYTKSGYMIEIGRVDAINRNLMNEDDQFRIVDELTSAFKPETGRFSFFSIPRTVDMEAYMGELVNQYDQEILNIHRKEILEIMIQEASQTVMGGNNFEHQFYIITWEKYNPNDQKNQFKLDERMNMFIQYYSQAKVQVRRQGDTELIRLCNLFSNGTVTLFESYEGEKNYIPIPQMKRK